MGIYLLSLILGAAGLLAMAATGLGRHGTGAHGHGASTSGHGHGGLATGRGHAAHGGVLSGTSRAAGWMLMSPRFLLAGLLGFGAAGVLLHTMVGGVALFALAVVAGVAFERLLVAKLWNFALRFASNPAITLDAAITSEAVAVTNFDRAGQGIISVEVDGQVQQILATLSPADRATGANVRAGQRVRIEDVDTARHRCSVSLL